MVENLASAEQTVTKVGAAPQQLADTEHAAATISEPQHLQINYFHTDQVGIVKEVSNLDGKLIWYGNYSAWGKLIQEQKFAPSQQPFRLQNQYFDQETGLHYNLMRYYDASCGRFINQDPIGLIGGDNLYQFAPNATGWVDPKGEIPFLLILVALAVGEAVIPTVAINAFSGKPLGCVNPVDFLISVGIGLIPGVPGVFKCGQAIYKWKKAKKTYETAYKKTKPRNSASPKTKRGQQQKKQRKADRQNLNKIYHEETNAYANAIVLAPIVVTASSQVKTGINANYNLFGDNKDCD